MTAHRRITLVVLLVMSFSGVAHPARKTTPRPDEMAIRKALETQVAAWNRGDIVEFMRTYKDSPDTTFVGKSVEHGYAPILRRYQTKYASKDQMGLLSFDGIEVSLLDAHYATVIGRFHLARSATAGGDANGIFSLVFEKASTGWKIVLDHTSS